MRNSPVKRKHPAKSLSQRYPPSSPCQCEICRGYCRRPGWWTVAEARHAISAGYASRMMLELSPDHTFGVLSPAFRGCEQSVALQAFSKNGCTFLRNGLCELHGSGLEPLECRFCHHLRQGLGQKCHTDLEKDWHTSAGQALVNEWLLRTYAQKINRSCVTSLHETKNAPFPCEPLVP